MGTPSDRSLSGPRSIRRNAILSSLVLALACGCGQQTPMPLQPGKKPPPAAAGTARSVSVVQANVRQMMEAAFKGDFDAFLAMRYVTPDDNLQKLGALKPATDFVNKLAKRVIGSTGITVESITFPEDPTYVSGAEHEFAIVPFTARITLLDERSESEEFMIGVREVGAADWKYLGGGDVTAKRMKELFSDFPDGVELPKISKRKL